MNIDISELEQEAERRCSLIVKDSIRIIDNRLSFLYHYLDHWPKPYDGYYDSEKSEYHIIVQRNAPTVGSNTLIQTYDLPKAVMKIKIDLRGEDIDSLSTQDRLRYFFPKLGN